MSATHAETPGWQAPHLFVAEHHLGLPIEEDLLVVLDSWEHAFLLDYGIKRPD
jgi:Fe-Mn family superoxide dismutase